MKPLHMKRKFEMGRPSAMTKLSNAGKRIRTVRTRGGNQKFRALRLDSGNFSWGSEVCTRKVRVIDVVYNATNNELVRTKTLVKNTIVQVDATPFRQWYEAHYAIPLGRKKGKQLKQEEEEVLNKKRSNHAARKVAKRAEKGLAAVEPALEEQFSTGRLLACISSRPGQSGRCDGYILEGKELEFYQRCVVDAGAARRLLVAAPRSRALPRRARRLCVAANAHPPASCLPLCPYGCACVFVVAGACASKCATALLFSPASHLPGSRRRRILAARADGCVGHARLVLIVCAINFSKEKALRSNPPTYVAPGCTRWLGSNWRMSS